MTPPVDAPTTGSAGITTINSRYGALLQTSTATSSSSRENRGTLSTLLQDDSASSSPVLNPELPSSSFSAPPQTLTMGHSSQPKPTHSSLEIVMPSDKVFVKGVGSMAEPGLLSGNLVLTLSEPTSIKEITLQMRGKAKLPAVAATDSSRLPSGFVTSIVYAHDWSFLAGEQRTSRTLKAGRHVFPFQVEIDASVPSTIETHNSSWGISYKLRATAVKSGIVSNNLHAQSQISILRSLALDALEYQQTLEIENTWPDKIMYSISIPHKAWAAGDTVCALVKFSPLRKGISIKSVVSKVSETTKVHCSFGTIENSRVVASIKHTFGSNGKPLVVDTYNVPPSAKSQGGMFHVGDGSGVTSVPGSYSNPPSSSHSPAGPSTPYREDEMNGTIPIDYQTGALASTSAATTSDEEHHSIQGEEDVVAVLPVTLPTTSIPSHTADPVDVHYRVRWVVGVLNPDGHVSELRCSLPLMVLDHSLLTEARLATNETRSLLFGPASEETRIQLNKDIELPSYDNHVLDRVANSFFPTNASRVNNVWTTDGMSTTLYDQAPQPLRFGLASAGSSNVGTPHAESEPILEWVNCELMTSLGESWRNNTQVRYKARRKSGSESEAASRKSSRPSSRASSPERWERGERPCGLNTYTHSANHGQSTPSLVSSSASSSVASTSGSSSSRQHSLFNLSLKPFTSITNRSTAPPPPSAPVQPVPLRTEHVQDHEAVLMSAFTEVPDYNVASRGFLGGGIPPLESMRGLPSYEDSERRSKINTTTSTPT